MSDVTLTFPDLGNGPVVVRIDAAFEPLVPKFMTNRRREVTAMTEALTREDFDTIRIVAHGIKGAGGTYGFDDLSVVGARLEEAAKRTDAGTIRQGLVLLASYLDRLQVVYE